jgi:hypothetical protein
MAKHKIKIKGYDYDKKGGIWVDKDIDCELNDDESLAGYSMPVTPDMREHMTKLYRKFLYETFPENKKKAEEQTVYFTFGKEALMFLLSQANCDGITFCLGINDKDDANKHTTLIAFGAEVRKKKDGTPDPNDEGKIIIDPIGENASKEPKAAKDLPRPIYEVVPPTTLAQVLAQEEKDRKKENLHGETSPSYTTFL